MLSRHLLGCVIVTRDGIDRALAGHSHDCASRLLGGENFEWSGWRAHTSLWDQMRGTGRTVAVSALPSDNIFLPPEEGKQGEGEWWKAGQKNCQRVGEFPLRILAAILKGARTRERVRDEVFGENTSAGDFRVALHRFREKMGSLTGLDPDEFGKEDHPKLPETLTIFGAVNRFTYSRSRS